MKMQLQSILAAAMVAAAVGASAESSFRDLMDTASATMDAARESREQNAAAADVRAIFEKAKVAADENDKLNLCGFYTGMSAVDARTLGVHYALKYDEWDMEGDPVYKITLSLKGIRRVTKGGNTFDELAQAVANRVGNLKKDMEIQGYSLKTIDGITVTMSESSGFSMFDDAERKNAGKARIAAEHKAKEEAAKVVWSFRTEARTITISGGVELALQSVPGGLWFGKTEVTQAQWEAVMGENPSSFKGADNPVENVSWEDCQTFLKKLNDLLATKESDLTFRLPTAEEWEAACRAGATGSYCRLADGSEISESTLGQVAWFADNSDKKRHPVGQKKPNAFGLYDMHGNVCEWTSTTVGESRLILGGGASWVSWMCKTSNRRNSACSPVDRFADVGFRLCADTKGEAQSGMLQNISAEALPYRFNGRKMVGVDGEYKFAISDSKGRDWYVKKGQELAKTGFVLQEYASTIEDRDTPTGLQKTEVFTLVFVKDGKHFIMSPDGH